VHAFVLERKAKMRRQRRRRPGHGRIAPLDILSRRLAERASPVASYARRMAFAWPSCPTHRIFSPP
jgi:hypothetical protein